MAGYITRVFFFDNNRIHVVMNRNTVMFFDHFNRVDYRHDLWDVIILNNLDRVTDNRAKRWTVMVHFKTNSLSGDTITYCNRSKVDWMYVHSPKNYMSGSLSATVPPCPGVTLSMTWHSTRSPSHKSSTFVTVKQIRRLGVSISPT